MKDLVIMQERKVVTTSLMISMVFDKRHSHVIEAIESKIRSAENSAYFNNMFYEGTYVDKLNRVQKQYFMTRDGFSFIAFGFTGKKADEFKIKYIEAFNKMEKQLLVSAPTNMIEALTLALEQQKEIESKDKKILELEPKALFADSVSSSKTSILIGDLAKILKQKGCDIGQNRLFEILRQDGFLIRRKGSSYNMPTQRSMEMELMEITESTFVSSDGNVRITKTPRITGKGQIYFLNKYLEDN